jgi:hypothetical protein
MGAFGDKPEAAPFAVAFNGKRAAEIALGIIKGRKLEYGPAPKSLAGAYTLVLPSTSAAAGSHELRFGHTPRVSDSSAKRRREPPSRQQDVNSITITSLCIAARRAPDSSRRNRELPGYGLCDALAFG